MLLDYGADPNDVDRDGRTALHTASNAIPGYDPDEEAITELIKMLVDRGADLEAVDGELGTTPLGWAIRYGRAVLARYFIEAGASIEPEGVKEEATPKALAEMYGDEEIRALVGV